MTIDLFGVINCLHCLLSFFLFNNDCGWMFAKQRKINSLTKRKECSRLFCLELCQPSSWSLLVSVAFVTNVRVLRSYHQPLSLPRVFFLILSLVEECTFAGPGPIVGLKSFLMLQGRKGKATANSEFEPSPSLDNKHEASEQRTCSCYLGHCFLYACRAFAALFTPRMKTANKGRIGGGCPVSLFAWGRGGGSGYSKLAAITIGHFCTP